MKPLSVSLFLVTAFLTWSCAQKNNRGVQIQGNETQPSISVPPPDLSGVQYSVTTPTFSHELVSTAQEIVVSTQDRMSLTAKTNARTIGILKDESTRTRNSTPMDVDGIRVWFAPDTVAFDLPTALKPKNQSDSLPLGAQIVGTLQGKFPEGLKIVSKDGSAEPQPVGFAQFVNERTTWISRPTGVVPISERELDGTVILPVFAQMTENQRNIVLWTPHTPDTPQVKHALLDKFSVRLEERIKSYCSSRQASFDEIEISGEFGSTKVRSQNGQIALDEKGCARGSSWMARSIEICPIDPSSGSLFSKLGSCLKETEITHTVNRDNTIYRAAVRVKLDNFYQKMSVIPAGVGINAELGLLEQTGNPILYDVEL